MAVGICVKFYDSILPSHLVRMRMACLDMLTILYPFNNEKLEWRQLKEQV